MDHPNSPEITTAFDDFMKAFDSFKQANDERLTQLETRMGADVVTEDKVNRINDAIDQQKRQLDHLILKAQRPSLGGDRLPTSQQLEHKAAFETYLRSGDEQAMRALEGKAMSVGSDADGGYLVPEELSNEIGRRLTALSPIRSLATVRRVSGSVFKKPFAETGPAVGWVGETDARPETDSPTLAELSFPAMELYAMPAATTALLEDAAVDLESWIAEEVEAAFAEQEGTAFVDGNGNNKPSGFLRASTVIEANWSWGKLGFVPTGASGAFDATNGADVLVDVIYALKAGYRQNAHFVMNRKTQAALRKLKDNDGNYLWQAPASADAKAVLMGFAVVEAEDMPDMSNNSLSIAFGDFRRGYLVVDRTGVNVLRDPYTNKPYVMFYTTKRVGGGIQDYDAIKLIKFGES
ncbi:MAG: phage major capsid protein [Hyphomicrobiales bacterium]|nr:phage major capsid protein [Hyphomicrobiales bacterium]